MPTNANIKLFFVSLSTTLFLGIFYFWMNSHFDYAIWQDMKISKSALIVEYCELYRTDKLFHQPVNTYSNLFYFFLGSIMVGSTYLSQQISTKNKLQQFPALAYFAGLSMMYLCVGSSFFHASMTWVGQRVDMNATYAVCISCLALCLYYFQAYKFTQRIKTIFLFSLLVCVLGFVYLHLFIPSTILLPFLILIISVLTCLNFLSNKNKLNIQYAGLSLLFVSGAFVLRTLDVLKIVCNPISFFQGHSLWHLFTGLGAFFLFWFYFSEKENTV